MWRWFGKTLDISHGAAAGQFHSNTLRGIVAARVAGFDGIEIDVHATRDHALVLCHDPIIRIGGRRVVVNQLSLEELRLASVASGHGFTTLREALEQLVDTLIIAVLDIKSRGIVEDVIALVREMQLVPKTLIASFDYSTLLRARSLDASVQTIFTVGLSRTARRPTSFAFSLFGLAFPLGAAKVLRANAVLCPAFRLTDQLVRRAHRQMLAVFVWKIKRRDTVATLRDHGVDGVVTDWLDSCR
jgi:glycerophosphoryl diester phosphodiesterase